MQLAELERNGSMASLEIESLKRRLSEVPDMIYHRFFELSLFYYFLLLPLLSCLV